MIKLNQVCYQRLLPTLPESEDGGNVVLDNNFALLQTGNRSPQVLQITTGDAELHLHRSRRRFSMKGLEE